MTTLAPYPPITQWDGTQPSWDYCGLADLVSAGRAHGMTFTLGDVVVYFHTQGWDPGRGSTAQQIAQAALHFHVPCAIWQGPATAHIDRCLAAGHATTVLIRSDGWGNPAGMDPQNLNRADHWIIVWEHEGQVYGVMNSLGEDSPGHPHFGMDRVYTAAQLEPVLESEGIEWTFTYGGVPPTMATAPSQEDDMVKLCIRAGTTPDPNGPGAVYLVNDYPYGPKRHIVTPGDEGPYIAAGLKLEQVDPFILDRMEDGPEIHSGEYPKET